MTDQDKLVVHEAHAARVEHLVQARMAASEVMRGRDEVGDRPSAFYREKPLDMTSNHA